MARTNKPSVWTRCPAETASKRMGNTHSRIVEFSFSNGQGGLMEFRTLLNGKNVIHIYNTDAGINVTLPYGHTKTPEDVYVTPTN